MSDLFYENERHMSPIVAAFHHKVWQQICAKSYRATNSKYGPVDLLKNEND